MNNFDKTFIKLDMLFNIALIGALLGIPPYGIMLSIFGTKASLYGILIQLIGIYIIVRAVIELFKLRRSIYGKNN